MNYLGEYRIDDYITIAVQLHRFSSGAVYAPTGNVTYTFYENNSTTGAPTGGNLAQLNSKTGLYSVRVQLTNAAGFEVGKEYLVHIEATVDSVAAGEVFMFRTVANPKVDVDTIKTQAVTCSGGVTVPAATLASTTNITGASGVALSATGLDAIGQAATGMVEIAKAVWDRVLTGATHNIATSAGRRLRTASGGQLDSGTAQAGGADSITLATSASTTAGLYVGCMIAIDGGTGVGQSRYIVGYTAGRIAYVARHWTTAPDNTSTYVLYADSQVLFIHMGLAQAGGASTITLQSTASAVDNIYNGQLIRVLSGTGDDQIRLITAYNGTTKVATVEPAWTTQPDSTSYYGTLQSGIVTATQLETGALADVRTAVGLAAANLDTQLSAIDDYIDTEVAAIKAQTDKLAFTGAGPYEVKADVVDWKGSAAPAMTGDSFARLGAPAGASVSADVAAVKSDSSAIKAKTDNLPASPAAVGSQMDLVNAPNATAVTAIQSGLATSANQTTILNRIGAFTGSGVNTVLGFFKALLNKAASTPSDVGGTFDPATDSTEAIRDTAPLGTAMRGTDNALLAASYTTPPTVGAIADQVWDEAISGHLGAGSTGNALNAAGSAGDPWSTPLPGAYGAGTAGKIVGDNVNATISSRGTGAALDAAGVRAAVGLASANLDAQLDAIPTAAEIKTAMETPGGHLAEILTDTGTTLPGTLSTIAGYIDTEIGTLLTESQSHPTLAEMEASTVLAKQAKLDALHSGIKTGTVDTAGFAATTTEFEADDITDAAADHYNGRLITFTSGTLLGEQTSISDYSLSGGRGHFTVVALTGAPGNNDTFIIT